MILESKFEYYIYVQNDKDNHFLFYYSASDTVTHFSRKVRDNS